MEKKIKCQKMKVGNEYVESNIPQGVLKDNDIKLIEKLVNKKCKEINNKFKSEKAERSI